MNTSGSSGQSDRNNPTRFPKNPVAKDPRSPGTRIPRKAVVNDPEKNVTRLQRDFATKFPRNRVAKFPGNLAKELHLSDQKADLSEDSFLKIARTRFRKPGKKAMIKRKRVTIFARKKGTLGKLFAYVGGWGTPFSYNCIVCIL